MHDVAVIGAGFGGLGAARALVEAGARVSLHEALRYPGGCASTFARDGYRFDAGATLVSGLGDTQLFGRWMAEAAGAGDALAVDWIDPVVELRAPGLRLATTRDRAALVASFLAMPGAPREGIARFFALQARVADALWSVLDTPELLPPFDLSALLRHAGRVGAYAPVLSVLGRPLARTLARFGLADFAPLRLWLDAVCQITVQCGTDEAEGPFALAALDYFYRGTGHVRGGVGALADLLLRAVRRRGGDVSLPDRVLGVTREDGGFLVRTRRGEVRARAVVANLVPGAARRVLAGALSPRGLERLDPLERKVEGGWGAVMLYLGLAADGLPPEAHHLELVDDASAPLVAGNHVFVSVGAANETDRAPPGHRPATLSTHVALAALRAPADVASVVKGIQARMHATLARQAPEVTSRIRHALPASPRTFERFTGRTAGAVGGIPRRAGLDAYGRLGPLEVDRGIWLVGDSVFPGQSALATAVCGVRTAAALARG